MLSSSNVLHTLFHELAHQWFGNLVTMEWQLIIIYIAVDKIFPDWDIWTHEIHQIFDAISYFKGASVIRMFSNFIGENIFLDVI
ncbi:hypothetical protein C2G38_881964 [Gigaspora rosea]|uniref:Peptidase M1 membrane alanine aminopeptidase domain-containing protein n=1 Tax=Gigaspora rosea TaxID=44941 RepID=A0A397TWK4_9GLOM|nr:hypothetical protein C2G38_881964 [Gigaspora rosea]